ncbi:hypothetical protein Tco_0318063 [Tanacetum coccineum]
MSKCSYASAVGSQIMYAVRCTRPDAALRLNKNKPISTESSELTGYGDMKRELRVSCYTDAGYLTDADDLKSQTGYAIGLSKFIYGLNVVPTIKEPITMYCDNIGDIAIANDHGVTKGARHFHVKVHYLRETINLGDVRIEKVDTDDNLADPFTKAL